MTCESVIREISNYIDGELEPMVQQELEQHLNGCKFCSLTVDQTRMTVQLFCEGEEVELPADVRTRLREGLRKKLRAES
jgi:anti-sigma factor RsiW